MTYAQGTYENERIVLRADWAGDKKSLAAELRWRRAKKWRAGEIAYERGKACGMRVSRAAHDKLIEFWRSVKHIDHGVPIIALNERLAWEARESDRKKKKDEEHSEGWRASGWHAGVSQAIVEEVLRQLRDAGGADVARDDPAWIAVDRAAARACQRWRGWTKTYGWNRPILDRDTVTTIRLPFGGHYDAPLVRIADSHWLDRTLLGEFEAAGAGGEPETCAYAECALLSPGWAIRFISVRPAAERGAAKTAADWSSPPPY